MESNILVRLMLLLTFSFFAFSCSESQSFNSNNISKTSDKAILEVTSNFKGLWWITGEVLDLRLYEDGFFEYDDYPSGTDKITSADKVKIRKQGKISEAELKELLDLVNSKEFTELKSEYKPKRSGTDAFIDLKIGLNDKTVIVSNHSGNLDKPPPEEFPNFPVVLSEFVKRVKKIKYQTSGKYFFTP